MQLVWTVGLKSGLQLVKNPEIDIFFTQSEALDEADNRGPEYWAYIVNKDEVIEQLVAINKSLTTENAILRAAVEG